MMPATGCVTLNGFDLFAADEADALRFVQAASQDSLFEDLGFIISPALGMTLTGFHDRDPSQKAITVFERGLWDDALAGAKPPFRVA